MVMALCTPALAHDTGPAAAPPQIIPKPVSTTVGHGQFTATSHTRIVARGAAQAIGRDLAGYLRPATGYPLPVVSGQAHDGDITIELGRPHSLASDNTGEGYQLDVTSRGVTLTAPTTHGLFDGLQTIRQLLPAQIASAVERPGPWTMPAAQVVDYPRYGYRGLMLDIARHYESPSAVEQLIDQAAAYKINTFHLHLSDDQGFRIVINGFPNLTSIGAQGSVGTGGNAMDPGGFWTQAQYKAVVAYAAAHYMTVVPEVDTPGHNNAIIMSEYNDTTNPRLDGHPQDINCGVTDPPAWRFTGEVGYSAMCPTSDNTWTILSAIIGQLTAMSPGPYYDLGGDEVPSNVLSQDQYASLVNQESGIVHADGKTAMGWAEIAGPGTTLPAGSIAEYWNPASGSSADTATATEAVQKGMKLVMAPASHAYLDMKYTRSVPATLGQRWACSNGCDVDQFYNWDPATYVNGVTDDNVIGVEGAVWSETLVTLSDVEYMAFPRLMALAELGWSPKVERTATSPAYQDFLGRLAAQGPRLMTAGVNFYPTPEVPWHLDLTAGDASVDRHGTVGGALARLSAPGFATTALTANINWGDGTTGTGTVTGTAASGTTVNGVYTIGGEHTYHRSGTYQVTVTVTAATGSSSTVVTLRVKR
jgi:hexosaminidase